MYTLEDYKAELANALQNLEKVHKQAKKNGLTPDYNKEYEYYRETQKREQEIEHSTQYFRKQLEDHEELAKLIKQLENDGFSSAFTNDTLLNIAYILREYSDIAEGKINALEKDLRGAFDRKETPLPEPPEPTMLRETFSSIEELPISKH